MLVLSRKRNESIVIDDNVIVTIVDIRGEDVRLGIEAPKEIPVHRQEVHDAIQKAKEAEEITCSKPCVSESDCSSSSWDFRSTELTVILSRRSQSRPAPGWPRSQPKSSPQNPGSPGSTSERGRS